MTIVNLALLPSANEITDRLLDWHDEAKLAGRYDRAEELLNLAWSSYGCGRSGPSAMRGMVPCHSEAGQATGLI